MLFSHLVNGMFPTENKQVNEAGARLHAEVKKLLDQSESPALVKAIAKVEQKTGAKREHVVLYFAANPLTSMMFKKFLMPSPAKFRPSVQILSLVDHTLTPKQNANKKITSSSKHHTKQTARKKLSPILEDTLTMPPQVTYLDGVPKDVGFGRGDQQQQLTGVWLSAKIYIPEVKGYSFIGRILGPRGISVRRLESETECKILIRGRGSIKDEKREQHLMNRAGWAHLHDKLHVLLLANHESEKQCRERLENAVQVIQRLLTPQYDEYKRQQLMHLAILNGTYRP